MKFRELRINKNDLSVGDIKIPAFFLFFLVMWCASFVTVVSAQEITSRAAVAMDAATGRVLYAKNPDNFLMPASTTKLMTALVVLDHASLSEVVKARPQAEAPASLPASKTPVPVQPEFAARSFHESELDIPPFLRKARG